MSVRAWVFACAALVGLGVVVVLAVRPGEPAPEPPGWTEPSSTRTPPEPVEPPGPGEPVPCAVGKLGTCFPDIDLPAVQRQLEELGTTCKRDSSGTTLSCMAGTDSDGAEIRMTASWDDPAKIVEVWFVASAGGTGPALEHRLRATGNLGEALENVLPLLLPHAPVVSGDIADWVMRTTGRCGAASGTRIGEFEVKCLDGSPITLSGKKGTITSWTVTAILSAPVG